MGKLFLGLFVLALAAVSGQARANETYAWLVYFADASPVLNDEDRAVIAAAVDDYNSFCPNQPVTLLSGTDTIGSSDKNLARSQAYGQAVLDELVKDGVSANLIRIEARGETHLSVATGDDVSEALNRVVEIQLADGLYKGPCAVP